MVTTVGDPHGEEFGSPSVLLGPANKGLISPLTWSGAEEPSELLLYRSLSSTDGVTPNLGQRGERVRLQWGQAFLGKGRDVGLGYLGTGIYPLDSHL